MTRILTLLAAVLFIVGVLLLFKGQSKDSTATSQQAVTSSDVQETDDSDFHTWKVFKSELGDFKVLLPGTPQYISDMVIDPKTLDPQKFETYAVVANNGAGYVINVISMPETSKVDDDSLKNAVNDMLERNKENKLKQMNLGVFNGKIALDFSMENKEIQIEGKVLAQGNKIYILSMISKEGKFNKKNYDFFINSFGFVEKEPKAEPQDQNQQNTNNK